MEPLQLEDETLPANVVEAGKSVQSQTGAPAALVNRYIKQIATEVLKKSPTSGRKQ